MIPTKASPGFDTNGKPFFSFDDTDKGCQSLYIVKRGVLRE